MLNNTNFANIVYPPHAHPDGKRILQKRTTWKQTRELKTACSHMMPPPLHVHNELMNPVDTVCHMYCEICEVIHYVAALVW